MTAKLGWENGYAVLQTVNSHIHIKTSGPYLKSILAHALCFFLFASSAQATSEDSWKVTQIHNIGGSFTFFLTPNAIKAVSKKGGYTVIARAPSWKVCVFNPAKKLMYETSLADWSRAGVHASIAPFSLLDVNKFKANPRVRPGVICSLNCRAYVFPFGNSEVQLPSSALSSFGQNLKSVEGKYREFDVTNDIKYTAERGALIGGLCKALIANALLVRQKAYYSNGKVQTEFDTIACEHCVIPDSDMQYPPRSYRKTTTVEDLAQTEYTKNNFKELFDGISGFGDPSAANRRK